jgi:uridine kinase
VIDSLERCRARLKSGSRLVIGVAGGSGSGKTTLAMLLAKHLGPELCEVLAQDSYYIDQSARFDGDGGQVNFDHPSSLDFELLHQQLDQLLELACGGAFIEADRQRLGGPLAAHTTA